MPVAQVKTKTDNSSKVSFRQLMPEIPSTTHGTFGIYRYPAKFIPQVIAYIIKHYPKKENTVVIDPFAGSGTTGLVSRKYGVHYEMWDLNPMLDIIHGVAIMEPFNIDVQQLVGRIKQSTKKFMPQWSRVEYWFPQEILPTLHHVWGYYHGLEDQKVKRLLALPLLNVTRVFSYNDHQRQKLSRSPMAEQRVRNLLNEDYQSKFYRMLLNEIDDVLKRLQENLEFQSNAMPINYTIISGKDSQEIIRQYNGNREWDLLITSPPYLQAQEYIRNSKLDLFWLGFDEQEIGALSKKEYPYQKVEPVEILSSSFLVYRKKIKEDHLRLMYDQYFYGVLGTLTQISQQVRDRMYIFVGPASVRSLPIPIDRIFTEHFVNIGWLHESTLIDTIVSRRLFVAKKNPATGLKDNRIKTERLIILKKAYAR